MSMGKNAIWLFGAVILGFLILEPFICLPIRGLWAELLAPAAGRFPGNRAEAGFDKGSFPNPQGDDRFVTVIQISPKKFDPPNSRWNNYGPAYEGSSTISKKGATHTHAFGANSGGLSYLFRIPEIPILAADITARLSSEFPFYRGPKNGQSDITLFVNGQRLTTIKVISDNGSGEPYTWEIPSHLLRVGENRVDFRVLPSSKDRNGLCIYDQCVNGREPDSPIQLRIWNKSA